jgi:hypothetical protein
MTIDPVTQLTVAEARHRARVRDALLRQLAASAPDRQWLLRRTRLT